MVSFGGLGKRKRRCLARPLCLEDMAIAVLGAWLLHAREFRSVPILATRV